MAYPSGPQTHEIGPFLGVRSTVAPWDDAPNFLYDATNGYIADGVFYARPGFSRITVSAGASVSRIGFFTHWNEDGTSYTFLAQAGVLYRLDSGVWVDVTPTNIQIRAGSANGFVWFESLADQLLVHDNSTQPWIGSSLGSTPIVATPIVYSPGGALSRGSTATRVANTAVAFNIAGTTGTCAAVAAGTALAAGTIPTDTWGVYRVTCNSSGTVAVSAGAANFTTGYASEAAAIAAVPAVTGSSAWNLGYLTVKTAVGFTFVGGTDALEGGAGGNPSSDTNYYAGQGDAWVAYGQHVIYGGCAVWILQTALNVAARTTITWSEPNQADIGYQQTNYDNNWTLTQTGSSPLYALCSTNGALFYARQTSWGKLRGQPSVNFENDANHDAVSENVGCVAPATVVQFGGYIYFADQFGRPYRMLVGGSPEPIWEHMRARWDTANAVLGATQVSFVEARAWASYVPNLNRVVFGLWGLTAGAHLGTLYCFSATTGAYDGIWTLASGAFCYRGGTYYDSDNGYVFAIMSQASAATSSGYFWIMQPIGNGVYQDNSVTITVNLTTPRIGYSLTKMQALTEVWTGASATTVQSLTVLTPTASTSVGNQTPVTSQDSIHRCQWNPQAVMGRGLQLTIAPTTTTAAWQCFGISAVVTESKAAGAEP